MARVAYVDESIRTDDGVYVLAAVTLDEDDADNVRGAIRRLEPRKGHRFHWPDQKDTGRLAAVTLVSTLASLHVVIIGRPVDPRRQERARKVIQPGIRVDHTDPVAESLLWAADIVAGAVGTAEGGASAYREHLAHLLTEYRIELR